ncbi:hypothetical protein PIB19_12470 [Sphingomonas sp. 7/4-4]|uniref:hypothetical protein n=1 Tax=Sphingomonas sp. 7/4-4 TaxID=3018446 RepID=UPI0022F3F905|nr:hypothetical protein [Sphingomonas sp. 7/4-4]WBY06414.1 hypothetical protein PIB19_12470 [Sphingomonas sp. 7/4-4]
MSDVINSRQYYVPNLDGRGLERAIREPAAMYGSRRKPELVVRLMPAGEIAKRNSDVTRHRDATNPAKPAEAASASRLHGPKSVAVPA